MSRTTYLAKEYRLGNEGSEEAFTVCESPDGQDLTVIASIVNGKLCSELIVDQLVLSMLIEALMLRRDDLVNPDGVK